MAYEQELTVALAAVRAASEVCRGVQRDLVTAQTLQKRDKSPVTVADFASQAVVCAMLSEAFPDDPIVGEEDAKGLAGDDHAELRASIAHHAAMSEDDALLAIDRGSARVPAGHRRFWTLDPIDGTKGFLRGEQYAVALALIEDGRVVLGVLGCPNLDRDGLLMAAIKGRGTQRLPLAGKAPGGEGETMRVASTDDPADARLCESVESAHSDQDASVQVAKALGITAEPYRIDSQCKYAAVARGDASVYLRLPTKPGYVEKIWDHAAGSLVVTEAGGRVTDAEGQPLDFSQEGGLLAANKGVVATNGKLHGRVIDAVVGVLHGGGKGPRGQGVEGPRVEK